MLPYERIIEKVSGNGRYQVVLMLMALSSLAIIGGFMNTGAVFLAGLPESHCKISLFGNETNLSDDVIKRAFIPWNDVTQEFDRCSRYVYRTDECLQNKTAWCVIDADSGRTIEACDDGYYYDRITTFAETVTTEWDLVCNRLTIKSASTSAYYIGMFIGALVGGVLADRFGRVFTFRIAGFLTLCAGIGSAYSPNIFVFSLARMFIASTQALGAVSGFVYVVYYFALFHRKNNLHRDMFPATEISKHTLRTTLGSVSNGIFGIFCVVLAGLAFHWRHWRSLSIALTMGAVPIIIFSFLLPKSPRWLLTQGKVEEAREVLKLMAKRNKANISDEFLSDSQLLAPVKSESYEGEEKHTIKELLTRPCTRYLIISNCFVWAITSLVYYGLALNSGELAGNVYVNHALGGVMEFAACFLSIPLIWKWGRQRTTVASLGLSSASCLLSTIIIQTGKGNSVLKTIGIVLAMIGRFCSSATFAVVYQHTVELFPTTGRATALGLSSMAARVGSITTPFTLQLQYFVPWLSPTIFGITAALAALFASTFPETKQQPLLTSFDEAESFFEGNMQNSNLLRMCWLNARRKNAKSVIGDTDTDELNKDQLLAKNTSV